MDRDCACFLRFYDKNVWRVETKGLTLTAKLVHGHLQVRWFAAVRHKV